MASFVWMPLTEPTYNRARLTRRLAGEDSEPEGTTQRITDLDESGPLDPSKATRNPRMHAHAPAHRSRRGQQIMEPLWSPVVATGGNQWQIGSALKPLEQAKTVAVGCDRLREKFHGKEGVSGSSPEEGSAKPVLSAGFALLRICTVSSVRWVWSRLWSSQVERSDPGLRTQACRPRRFLDAAQDGEPPPRHAPNPLRRRSRT
jgi:hypothetical protein